MNLNFTVLWIGLFSLSTIIPPENDACSRAHSSASYALFHSKKSLQADNFDHQRYYAERAIEALQKTQTDIGDCGCSQAKEVILDGMDHLQRAAQAEDWEKGRFYAKKSYAEMQNLIGYIEECSSGSRQTVFDDEEYLDLDQETMKIKEETLEEEQQKLLAEQQRLEEERRQIEKQLAAQKEMKQQLKTARKKELEKQVQIKVQAEKALQDFEASIVRLTDALDCREAYKVMEESYLRNEAVLEKESLSATKKYYINKAQQIIQRTMHDLSDCATY